MYDESSQKGNFQETLINKENVIYNTFGSDYLTDFIETFDEKVVLKLSENKNEIELVFRISFRIKSDEFPNSTPIEVQFRINRDLNYFLGLHESFVLFEKDLNFVFSKIKEKLNKKSFSISMNLSNSIIDELKNLMMSNDNSIQIASDLNKFNEKIFNNYIVLKLFFYLDEQKIILDIPINNLIRIGNHIIKEDELNEKRENSLFLRLSESKTVRKASKNDIPLILSFIKELAEFEKLLHEVTATEEILSRNLFGEKVYSEVLIYEINGAPVAFALFFHNFSTFKGKPGLYLEDIYVKPEFRNQGIGSDFFKILAKVAKDRDCGRFEWSVLNWNEKAIQFYTKMGAYPMSEWTVYRMDRENINRLGDQ